MSHAVPHKGPSRSQAPAGRPQRRPRLPRPPHPRPRPPLPARPRGRDLVLLQVSGEETRDTPSRGRGRARPRRGPIGVEGAPASPLGSGGLPTAARAGARGWRLGQGTAAARSDQRRRDREGGGVGALLCPSASLNSAWAPLPPRASPGLHLSLTRGRGRLPPAG